MACPYFVPGEPLGEERWLQPPRTPLGGLHRGACAADPAAEIPDLTLEEVCNWGYARGRCPRFPADQPVDALRLTQLKEDSGIRLVWIEEADHRPLEHGDWTPGCRGAALDAQARAFLARQRR